MVGWLVASEHFLDILFHIGMLGKTTIYYLFGVLVFTLPSLFSSAQLGSVRLSLNSKNEPVSPCINKQVWIGCFLKAKLLPEHYSIPFHAQIYTEIM